MNWKTIIKSAFELSNEDWELATKLRSLNESEREALIAALGPPGRPRRHCYRRHT